MDHDFIVEQLLDRCKGFIESILQAPDLQSVANASLAIFTQIRQVARDILQAKITLEAQQRIHAPRHSLLPGGWRDVCPHPDRESTHLVG